MLQIIKKILLKIINDIDAGNSNLTEKEAINAIETLNRFTNKEKLYSKYEAYRYLGVSRSTFDKYIKEGKLPKGSKLPGFKELVWKEKDLKI